MCFYFNGWIIVWSAVNFKSQYDAAIISAFETLKWNVWSCFQNGFHWNLKNTSGKTFLLAYSQVLCQKWALTVTWGMHIPRPIWLYGWGLHCSPLIHDCRCTINIPRGEQVTLQQSSLNATLGKSLKSSVCHLGSTGWQRQWIRLPARASLCCFHAKAWKRLSIRSEVTCGLSYCICSSWTPCHQRRGCQIK